MLLTGSKDTTVRVWNVGEEVLPHADEWVNIKAHFVLTSDPDADNLISAQNTASVDITALETAVVGANTTDGDNSSNATTSSTAGKAGDRDRQAGVWKDRETTKKEEPATQERAFRAVVKLRPELLRQAGARPEWRTGCIAGVMDPGGVSPRPRVLAETGKKSEKHHLIEVRYTSVRITGKRWFKK